MAVNLRIVYMFAMSTACLVTVAACQPPPPNSNNPPPAKRQIEAPFGTKSPRNDGELPKEVMEKIDSSDSIPFSIKDQCAKQICGDPAKVLTPSDIQRGATELNRDADRLFDTQFKPLLESRLNLRFQEDQVFIARAEESRERLNKVKLSRQETALLNLIWMMNRFGSGEAAVKKDSNGKPDIDMDILKKGLPEFSEADLDFFSKGILDLVSSGEYKLAAFVQSAPLGDILRNAYPKMSIEQARREFGRSLGVSIDHLRSTFPGLPLTPSPAIDALVSGKDLTPEMVNNLTTVLLLTYVDRQITLESSPYSGRSIQVAALVDRYFNGKTIPEHKARLRDTVGINRDKEELFTLCRGNVKALYLASPTVDEIKRAEVMLADAKQSVVGVSKQMGLRPDVQGNAEAEIQKVAFQMPLSRDEMVTSLLSETGNFIHNAEARIRAMPNFTDNMLFIKIYDDLTSGDSDVLSEVKNLCSGYAPKPIGDHAISGFGRVMLSWQSVKFPKSGFGIVTHELGHILSSSINSFSASNGALDSHYSTLKSCTSLRHGSDTITDKSEEDFADLIASKALRIGRKNADFENFACVLLGENNVRWGSEMGLTMAWPSTYPDSHSTSLFRLLQIQIQSGHDLPNACKSLAGTYAPATLLSCEARTR